MQRAALVDNKREIMVRTPAIRQPVEKKIRIPIVNYYT